MTDPVVQLLTLLQELYPHPPMTGPRLAVFRRALSGLSAEECQVAFAAITRTPRKFYPDTGEIFAAARPEPTSAECAALFDVIEGRVLFRRAGMAAIGEEFGEAARFALLAAGGLDACRCEGTDRAFALKRFTESYREERLTPRAALGTMDDRLAHLVGQTVKRLSA